MLFFKTFFFFMIPMYLTAIPLFWWEPDDGTQNFGDHLSKILIERILGEPIKKATIYDHKILGIGSILHFAREGDVVWGSGINGKHPQQKDYPYRFLDVRAVRGPLTQKVLKSFGIEAPSIYGDPGLLFARFFPEFQKNPIREYVVVIHGSEQNRFPRRDEIIFSTDPWQDVIQKIIESKFVISTSLHGIVIAEAFQIPARLLRITQNEPLFKYADYYMGTGRTEFQYAKSIKEALLLGGEKPAVCNLGQLLDSFPYELFKENL
jgi:pyruvyltransferase